MGSNFRRPPATEPPAKVQESEGADYLPEGQAESTLASVQRIAQAIPHRKVQRKAEAGEEKKDAKGESDTKEEAPAVGAKLDGVGRKVFLAPIDPTIPRLRVPAVPSGCSGLSDFGNRVMKWGTGDADARARMASVTKQEMVKAGVTMRHVAQLVAS